MALPTLNLVNQFGEVSENRVLSSSNEPGSTPQPNGTVVANISGSSAIPSAVTLQAFANKSPSKAGVTAISALATPVTGISIALALSTGNTYTDAAVNTAVNTAVNAALVSVVADLQAQLTQMNLILAQLKVVS